MTSPRTPLQRAGRVKLMRAAIEAMVIVTRQGQPCYRTSNGIPQGMPRQVERIVRRALEVL
jgi:hypothetical protein